MLGYILHKVKLKNIFLLIVATSVSFYIIQYCNLFSNNTPTPVLIWWTPFMPENERLITCPKNHQCLLTKDRKYLNNTNLQAFLFYGSNFHLWDLPVPKTKTWAIFHEESPRNVAVFLSNRTFEFFEIASTFSRYSDLPLTLQYLNNLSVITDTRYVVSVEQKNKLLNELAPVLYIQSDCDTPLERDKYVSELMQHIEVDSYGACLNNKKFPDETSRIDALDLYNEKLLKFIAQYKFIIAFENAICEDYITEKLWRPLLVGSVPIYLGSPSVEDWLPNKKSAILAQHLNPENLAQLIKNINTDDALYEEFLQHKRGLVDNARLKSTLERGVFGLETEEDNPVSAFECFVCRRIFEGVPKRSVNSLYDCQPPSDGSWESYWRSGECQSKSLINLVHNNTKPNLDDC